MVDDLEGTLKKNTRQSKNKNYVWGNNRKKMLGVIDVDDRDKLKMTKQRTHEMTQYVTRPSPILGVQLKKLRQGYQHGLGLGVNQMLYSWGRNRYGQVGRHPPDKKEGPTWEPIDLVQGLLHRVKIRDMTTGWNHCMAIT